MTHVGFDGYLERTIHSSRRSKTSGKSIKKDWWTVMPYGENQNIIDLGNISFKSNMLGKRVRFKVEVLEL